MMGPWSHLEPDGTRMGDLDFGPSSNIQIIEEELRWFDHWLKGIDTGVMEEPPLRIFVMGANQWRFESQWPLERTRFTPYYMTSKGRANSLHGNGTLTTELPGAVPPDQYEYDPQRPVPSIGGNNSTHSWAWTVKADEPIIPGPLDQRPIERRDDVLVYTGDALEKDLEVTGPVEMILYAASSAPDTDFTAKLVDVFPSGYAVNVTEGLIRARFRNSFEKPELLEPGEVNRYTIRLYPTSYVFKGGHRIRVDISSSNFPRFSRNLNTGEDVATGTDMQVARQTLFHSEEHPSHVMLPIIPT